MFSKLKLIGGGIVVAMMIGLALIARANGKLHDQIGGLQQAAYEVAEANRANVAKYDELLARYNALVLQHQIDVAAAQTVVEQLGADLAALDARRQKTITIYATPSCATLGTLDIGAACPALAEKYRALDASLTR